MMLTKSLTPEQYRALAKPKRSKFNVGPAGERTYAGKLYASKLEARYAQQLDVWKLAGAVKGWQAQIPFALHAFTQRATKPVKLGTYYCDFRVVWKQDDRVEFVECKGLDVPLGKWKRSHCEAEYQIKITVVRKV